MANLKRCSLVSEKPVRVGDVTRNQIYRTHVKYLFCMGRPCHWTVSNVSANVMIIQWCMCLFTSFFLLHYAATLQSFRWGGGNVRSSKKWTPVKCARTAFAERQSGNLTVVRGRFTFKQNATSQRKYWAFAKGGASLSAILSDVYR